MQGPRGDKGGASAAGVRYLLTGAQAWHAQAEACPGQMSAVSTGLRMAMMASGQQVDVDTVAPDAPKVTAAMEEVRRQYPPHRLTSAAMDPSFVEAVGEQSSQVSASRSSAPGGGGCVAHPLPSGPPVLSNHHECYPAPPPPQAWAVLLTCGALPPHCAKFSAALFVHYLGYATPPDLFAIFSAELFVFYLGYAMPPDVLHCWLSVSRNDNHWTGCVITHEHHPELAL